MNLKNNDISSWCDSLTGFEPEFKAVHCTTVLQFFVLGGRKTIISKENLEPIPDLHYALQSKAENKFYFKEYRNYPLDVLYYYRPSLYFSGDEAVSNLRQFVDDGNIWLLFNPTQIENMTAMLKRLYKANVSGQGKLDYKMWIKVLEKSLQIEDYNEFYKNGVGFKTQMKVFQDELNELWKIVSLKK
jgi:hypothetical protein